MVTQIDLVSFDRESKERQQERNFFTVKIAYSVCKMVLTAVVFALMISMILNNSTDYKLLSVAVAFLLIYEFLRTVRYNAI